MDTDWLTWLNRSGIILNFLAGFLLAPELIGVERIKRAESFIERILQTLEHIADAAQDALDSYFFPHVQYWEKRRLELLSIDAGDAPVEKEARHSSSGLVPDYRPLQVDRGGEEAQRGFSTGILSTVFLTLALVAVWTVDSVLTRFIHNTALRILAEILLYFLVLLLLFFGLAIASRFVGFLLRRLEGDEALRSVLVFWGIIFFVVGNLFQLIATF